MAGEKTRQGYDESALHPIALLSRGEHVANLRSLVGRRFPEELRPEFNFSEVPVGQLKAGDFVLDGTRSVQVVKKVTANPVYLGRRAEGVGVVVSGNPRENFWSPSTTMVRLEPRASNSRVARAYLIASYRLPSSWNKDLPSGWKWRDESDEGAAVVYTLQNRGQEKGAVILIDDRWGVYLGEEEPESFEDSAEDGRAYLLDYYGLL